MTARKVHDAARRVRLVACGALAALLWMGAAPAVGTPAVVEASGLGAGRAATGFVSNFNLHHNGWTVLSGSWDHPNGAVLHTVGVVGEVASAARIGRFGDFTFEARMKRLGCTSCANRLVVRSRVDSAGELDFAPAFFFQYSNEAPGEEGMFSVFKVKTDGSSVVVKGWTETPAVNKGGWNTLKVEAVGSTYHFYINGTLVWEGSRTGLSTGRVGISMYTEPFSTGDDFRVDWARLTLAP